MSTVTSYIFGSQPLSVSLGNVSLVSKQHVSVSWRPIKYRPLSVCRIGPPDGWKHGPVFNISPTALLCPSPPDGKERWNIRDEDNEVKLWFQVPGLSEENLDVQTEEDVIVIKNKRSTTQAYEQRVGSFHVRLLMTKEYDRTEVKANLHDGMLEVIVPRVKDRPMEPVKINKSGGTSTETQQ